MKMRKGLYKRRKDSAKPIRRALFISILSVYSGNNISDPPVDCVCCTFRT